MTLVRMARVLAVIAILIPLILMIGPFGAVEKSTGISDKIGHIGAFAVIAVSLALLVPRWSLWGIAGLSLAIGVGVEIIQGFVGRDADALDVVADAIGIAIACLLLAAMPSTPFRPKAS